MKRLVTLVTLSAIWLWISMNVQAEGTFSTYAPLVNSNHTGTGAYPSLNALTFGASQWSAMPRVSADGGVVAITTSNAYVAEDTNGDMDVYVWRRAEGAWQWVSAGADNPSEALAVSANGRYVLFRSWGNGLVEADGNGGVDIFRYDLETEQLEMVSVTAEGVPSDGNSPEAAISANGRWLFFSSDGGNVTAESRPCHSSRCDLSLYVRDMEVGVTRKVLESLSPPGAMNLWISDDGTRVAFQRGAEISNNCWGQVLFHYDLLTETPMLLATSVDTGSERVFMNGLTVSADGKWAGYSEERQSGQSTTHSVWIRNIDPEGPIYLIQLPTTHTQTAAITPQGGCGVAAKVPELTLSADGGRVGFVQTASNGTNNAAIYHRLGGGVTIVSRPMNGGEANGDSAQVVVSSNGESVWFQSSADNLVANDPNGANRDIFVWDNRAVAGTLPPPPIRSEVNSPSFITLAPRGGTLLNITGHAELGGEDAHVAADGNTVLFSSRSANLVVGDTNSAIDAFVWERASGTITRVSVKSDGTQGNGDSQGVGLSADGRYVLFRSRASFTGDDPDAGEDFYRHDRVTGKTQLVTRNLPYESVNGAISPDGQRVFFSVGYYFSADIYIYDFMTAEYTRVTAPNGADSFTSADFGYSADGQSMLYTDLTDGYCFGGQLYRQRTDDGSRFLLHRTDSGYRVGGDEVYGATYYSLIPSVGGEGWLTGFYRFDAPALIGRSGVWSMNGMGDSVEVYTFPAAGCQSRQSVEAAQSADGARVVFRAPDMATALHPTIAADTNGYQDILMYERDTDRYTLLSTATPDAPVFNANGHSAAPSISADGRMVAFSSHASNLVVGDTNFDNDVFVWVEE